MCYSFTLKTTSTVDNSVSTLWAVVTISQLADRFLQVEEQRMKLNNRNTLVLESVTEILGQLLERDIDSDRLVAQALEHSLEAIKLIAYSNK